MNVIIYFLLLIVELFVLLGFSIYSVGLLFSSFKGAPYVPTSKNQLEKILENAHLKKKSHLVELGSGDGRLVRLAVKKYGITGVGLEINPLLVWWSNHLARRDGTSKKVQFVRKNVFDYPLENADFLYVFLMPELIRKLVPKFKKELKKGAIIVSHGFKIVDLQKRLVHTEYDKRFSTYYYKI